MTRNAHLTRIALGRSAYEPEDFVIPPPPTSPPASPSTSPSNLFPITPTPTASRFAHSVRPIPNRPSTHKRSLLRSSALRRAKNEILELVGVTERCSPSSTSHRHAHSGRPRIPAPQVVVSAQTLACTDAEEAAFGGDMVFATDLTHLFSEWWLDTLRARLQAGLVKTNAPFVEVLRVEGELFGRAGWWGRWQRLTAGLGVDLLGSLCSDMLYDLGKGYLARVRKRVCFSEVDVWWKKRLLRILDTLGVGMYVAIELLFFPISIFATLQRLHLHNSIMNMSVLPTLLPWHPRSALRWGMRPGPSSLPLSSRLFNIAISPLTLCIFHHAISDWGARWFNILQDFPPQPAIIAPSITMHAKHESTVIGPGLAARLIRTLVKVRTYCLHSLGWSHQAYLESKRLQLSKPEFCQVPADQAEDRISARPEIVPDHRGAVGDVEVNAISPIDLTRTDDKLSEEHDEYEDDSLNSTSLEFRTTTLSLLPQEDLSHQLNGFLWKTAKIPLQIILYRSVVRAWQQDPLYSVQSGLSPSIRMPGPGLFSSMTDDIAGSGTALVAKVVMCLGIELLIDAATWAGLYFYVKHVGTRRFLWGAL